MMGKLRFRHLPHQGQGIKSLASTKMLTPPAGVTSLRLWIPSKLRLRLSCFRVRGAKVDGSIEEWRRLEDEFYEEQRKRSKDLI